MVSDFIHRVAMDRFNGWNNREKFTQLLGDLRPADMKEAYEVQSELYSIMRTKSGFTSFAGHKVALTSPAIQEMCGVDEPAYGRIFSEFVHSNGHEIDPDDFIRLGIEFEIAFEIGEDIPILDHPHTIESVSPYIAAAIPAFELIDDRDADYSHLDAISILCDRCWCNGVVLGERFEQWRDLDVGNLETEVVWNGVADEKGHTSAVLGHPLNSVVFVANHLQQLGQQLKTDEVIMTGSALKTRFPSAGDTSVYRVKGLGEVSTNVKA